MDIYGHLFEYYCDFCGRPLPDLEKGQEYKVHYDGKIYHGLCLKAKKNREKRNLPKVAYVNPPHQSSDLLVYSNKH